MRKLLAALLAILLIFSCSIVLAESIDVSTMTDDQLWNLIDEITTELKSRHKTEAAGINEEPSFEDVEPSTDVDLNALLMDQPLAVKETEYLSQSSDDLKFLYPDMLSAILVNNSDDDIKNAVVAFVAWDKNNLPVKIETQFDFTNGSYVRKVDYDDINLTPGDTFGKNKGLSLADDCSIAIFKAIAVSYETFEGKTWKNPYFEDFCELYEGKKLEN